MNEYKLDIDNLTNQIKEARNIIADYEFSSIKYIEENK
jgi:hypothetical protein